MPYFNTGNEELYTKKIESAEDRMFRLAAIHNKILHQINSIQDGRDIQKVRSEIRTYEKEVGENSVDLYRLKQKFSERITELTENLDIKIKSLNDEIFQLKSQSYTEPIDKIREINERANDRMFKIMLELDRTKDNGTNRRKIGNYVQSADRVTAVALSHLYSIQRYETLFTDNQRKIIAEKIQSPAEIAYKKNINTKVADKSKQLAKYYMLAFGIRNVMKQIANEENKYYFK